MQPITEVTSPNLPARLQKRVLSLAQTLRYTDRRLYVLGLLSLLSITVAGYTISFFWPRSFAYSYSTENCSNVPTFLPSLHKVNQSPSYNLTFKDKTTVAGFHIVASKSCVTLVNPTQSTSLSNIKLAILGSPLSRTFRVHASPAPVLSAKQTKPMTVATTDKLTYKLDKPDKTFTYVVKAGQQTSKCDVSDIRLTCGLSTLQLAQGQQYKLAIEREFKNQSSGTVATHTITTVEALSITGSSVAANSTVYHDPKTLTISFNKEVGDPGKIAVTNATKVVPASITKSGSQLTISFAESLPRSTKFDVSVDGAKATDKGYLLEPFKTSFTTSGGPKVASVNIGESRVSQNPTIVLTFDTAIKPEAISQFITADVTGIGSIAVSSNQATIKLARSLNTCEAVTLNVSDKLANSYGFNGNNAWKFTTRASCGSSFSIGNSTEGRSITAWRFGSGTSTVLYVGGTHGNELSSKYTLDSWISYLDANAYKLPAGRSIVVVPAINPDGIARSSRLNAKGVDLNRNFPANSWKADVVFPGSQLTVNGGGTSPLSEQESSVLAAYVQSAKPRMVLTYHSKGSLVTVNESGDSLAQGTIYGQKAGYRVLLESQLGNTFNYDTTGAFENWLHDKLSIPALLIELPSHTSDYFSTNLNAMWAIATL